jgi:uncharacterized protein YjbI with pentapeptide repeats
VFAPGIDLSGCWISGRIHYANLNDANLRGARLTRWPAIGCGGRGMTRRRARLEDATMDRITIRDADLREVAALRLHFSAGVLHTSRLCDARLDDAILQRTQFARCSLDRASLRRVDLRGACLDDASVREADLGTLEVADLEARRANFARARLTGSRLRGANLQGALLVEARLAEVDWEGADLRGADLTRASFHLGSSRSGLISSPIASEGSRTGFYTDAALDDAFAAPEDVRMANLCGVDLRGADIEGTDFYLVDLRGARLDPDQLEWLRRCKAILSL